MTLLLTSGGVPNPSLRAALIDLLGKPIAACHALCIPTAQWGHPMCGPASARGFIVGAPPWHHMCGLGWASLGRPLGVWTRMGVGSAIGNSDQAAGGRVHLAPLSTPSETERGGACSSIAAVTSMCSGRWPATLLGPIIFTLVVMV